MNEENGDKNILEQFSRKYLKILDEDILPSARKAIEEERKSIIEEIEGLDKEIPRELCSLDREIMEKKLNLTLERLDKISYVVEHEWREMLMSKEE